ncbi:MAG: zinc-binding dehydrogenase, partial [Alphaproteobacteria bacterium]|nr:zinc-binding dehydrogenase [Alphaproteobacteria bacterium]
YSTAENMLARTEVGSGDTVLVTGASGGVGSAAVQLARARGATVIAVTQARKAEALRAIGAGRCAPRGPGLLDAVGRDSVDVVIDLTAGPDWPLLPELLRPFGRYAVAGAIAGPIVALDVRTLYLKDLTFFGCTVLGDGVFASLIAHIEAGRIAPLVAASYPLKDITKAQAAFQRKDHIGKIVLGVGTPDAPESQEATE